MLKNQYDVTALIRTAWLCALKVLLKRHRNNRSVVMFVYIALRRPYAIFSYCKTLAAAALIPCSNGGVMIKSCCQSDIYLVLATCVYEQIVR